MKKELFYVLVILCIITHIIRTIYEILKHKKKIKVTRVSFIIVFFNMLLLWGSWFTLCTLDIFKLELPGFVHYTGISLVIIGIIIFLTSLFTIKTLESYEGTLITHGIYSKVRHPMYLGFILWLIGMPLLYEGIISFALCVLFIANVLIWRYLEEKELENRFSEYREYREKTIF